MSDSIDPTTDDNTAFAAPTRQRHAARGSGRQRAIAVETEGLGLVKVRRVSLGGFARCADRLRAEGRSDDDALVDALIDEVVTMGGDAAGESPDPERLGQLTDTDRRSIAAAVLTLEGVKAAGEGVLQDPLVSLAERYGPMVGLGDHARALPSALQESDDPAGTPDPGFSLPGEAASAALAGAPEPQIPLFDRTVLPPTPEHRLPEDAAPAAPTRAARAAAEQSKTRFQQLLDAQNQALLELEGEHRALVAEAAALSDRADRAERAARRHRWVTGAAVAAALLIVIAQAVSGIRAERRLEEAIGQLESKLQRQGEALGELRAAAARNERGAAARAPKPAAGPAPTTRPRARTDGSR